MNPSDWYKPMPDPPKIPHFKPCICGYNARKICQVPFNINDLNVRGPYNFYYRCNNCGLMGPLGINQYDAKIAWNQMIERGVPEKHYDLSFPEEIRYRFIPKKEERVT